jgi:6-phosphogluconolactonase
MGRAPLRRFPHDDALAGAAADAWVALMTAARQAGRLHLVALSGGRITRNFFAAAVQRAAASGLELDHVHFFWADERCLPPTDAESNFRLAQEALFTPANVPAANIHRLRGELDPVTAANAATAELRQIARCPEGMPRLDLVLLGMGEDGHVASLFPGHTATEQDLHSVFLPVTNSPKPPADRLTLGHGPIAAATAVWVLASGQGKHAALQQSLAPTGVTPLARVLQRRAETTIFTDVDLNAGV